MNKISHALNPFLQIGDFGLSRFVTDESMRGTLKDVRSTLTHCAPEVWKGRHWTPASDMYSVAIVMWEMGTRVLTVSSGCISCAMAEFSFFFV